jgi:L-lactate utilization protein LutC
MSARERVLARVRAAQAAGAQRDNIEQPTYPLPPVGPELVTHFSQSAARLGSEVLRVSAPSAVPAAVARYLATYKLPARAVCWPELAALPWALLGIDIEVRAARGDDVVGITGAFCAIAETGTLMLLSGAQTPATVSLLPETHIAVVTTSALVATMEEAWARQRAPSSGLPRAVNFISGPSRTADVEQTVTLGAHGPRSVLIVLVDG